MKIKHLNVLWMAVAGIAVLHSPSQAQSSGTAGFPATFGSYAPGGNCARLPRVIVNAAGIELDSAAGTARFPRPDIALGYGGREDNSTTFFTQGPGDGLVISIDGDNLWTNGGDHLGGVERAVDAIGSHDGLRRCGAAAAKSAPPVAAAPKMRTKASRDLNELSRLGFLEDPGFHAAYLKALGPLKTERWLIDMDGPGDNSIISIRGIRYLQVQTCKDRDCGDNAMLVLYRPETGTLYGVVQVRRKKVTIGNPPKTLVPTLMQLWRKAWPAG